MQIKRKIVVILGVHRSGTSLAANFSHALGVEFGQDLLPADARNAKGYWESRTIRKIQDQILAKLNCQWHNPPLFFPSNWQHRPDIEKLKSELLELVRSESGKTEGLWGFKDPRTAILLPMWQEIFDELDLEPCYLLSVRNPASVAASLKKRDRIDVYQSQALWLKTNLEVFSRVGSKLKAILDYDRWFDSGLDQGRRLANCLALDPPPGETLLGEAVARLIRPELRHHASSQEQPCSPIVQRFYSVLRDAAIQGKIGEESGEILDRFKKSRALLEIWDAVVLERDSIINQNNTAMKRLKKQKNLFLYATFTLAALLLGLSSFVFFSGKF